MHKRQTNHNYRELFIGADTQVPLLSGQVRTYVNLDNAASTPPLKVVGKAIEEFLPYYSSVHRGTGYKSQLSTHYYETARQDVLRFVNADPAEHTCIFGKNTTEALNKLARRFPFTAKRNVVITTGMEHHSNDLPWRYAASTVHVDTTPDGHLDMDDFDRKLELHREHLALVTVTGASNVTGYLNPIHELAEKTHLAGGQIAVDAAQLAPHRRIDMRRLDDPTHLDYITIAGHKMYAPFGTGALVGRRDTFGNGIPDMTGGGTVEIVTLDDVVYAGEPERDEAGSPNTVGAVALSAAVRQLEAIGMENVATHESELTAYALERLNEITEVRIYGDSTVENNRGRLGVIPMEVLGMSHFKVAAILGYEFGVGVRSGCFCAHPYLLHLLGLSAEESNTTREHILAGDRTTMPGMIRASFGLYNTIDDVDVFVDALIKITRGEYQGRYIQDRTSGEFVPDGWQPDFERYFSLDGS